MIIVRFTSTYV